MMQLLRRLTHNIRFVKMVSKSQLLVFIFLFLLVFVLINFIIVAVRKFQERLPRVKLIEEGCPAKVSYNHTLNPHTSLIYTKTYAKFKGTEIMIKNLFDEKSFRQYFGKTKSISEQRERLLQEVIPTTEFTLVSQLRELLLLRDFRPFDFS